MTLVLGSIHAFSVLVPQWEADTAASRASVSLVYSLSLLSLTMAVLLGYRAYSKLRPAAMVIVSGVVSALGLLGAAAAHSTAGLCLSYGIIFGAGNGLGYGYALQLAGQAMPQARGLAMGLVTAFYAVGATLAPALLLALIPLGGNALALTVCAALVLLTSLGAGAVLHRSQARYKGESPALATALQPALRRARWLLWIAYGAGVAAGLMVIGHAYAIAAWLAAGALAVAMAPTLVALGNMLGGFCAGYVADRWPRHVLLVWLPAGTVVGLALLWLNAGAVFGLAGLFLAGLCYGALIAVYPVAIADLFGTPAAARIYGQIFTAWGVAGLFGPWSSGWLYDNTHSYSASLAIAALLSVVSMLAVRAGFAAAGKP